MIINGIFIDVFDEVEIAETTTQNGGSGSGNFGHAGRPGKVGGSKEKERQGMEVAGEYEGSFSHDPFDVFRVRDASEIMSDNGTVAIRIGGREVLYSPKRVPHHLMIQAVHGGETVDDYVRLLIQGGIIKADLNYVGIPQDDFDKDAALDRMYEAIDILLDIGLPKSASVEVYGYRDGGDTSYAPLKIKANSLRAYHNGGEGSE